MTYQTKDLLPCPFCGAVPQVTTRASSDTTTGEICFIACFCGGYSACAHKVGDTKESAFTAWNRRASATSAPVQTLTAAIMAEREACALACEAVADHAEEARTKDAIASLAKTASTKSKLAEYKHLLTVQTFNSGIARCAEAIRVRPSVDHTEQALPPPPNAQGATK